MKFSATLGGVSVEAKISYTIDYAFSVGITDKDFASLIVKRETEFTTELDVKLDKIEGYEKEEWLPWPIYTLGAGNKIGFTLNAGLFFEYKGSLNLTAKLPYKSTHVDNYYWSSDQPFQYLENKSGGWPGWEEYLTSGDVKLKMKGSVAFGPIIEASFQVWKPSFLSIDARAKGGLELSGEISLDMNELMTGGFDAYKTVSEDMKITTGLKVGGEIGYTVKEDFNKLLSADVTLFKKERYLFPRFTRPSLPFKTENGWEGDVKPLSMFSVPSNLLFFPGKVGLAVYDDAGKSISKTYGQSWFFGGDDWPKSWLQTDISGLQQGKTYTVKPIFRMLNIFDVVATPNYQFTVPDHLSVAQSEIKLQKGASKFIIINDGWGDFKVEVDHPNLVKAEIKETASASTSSVQIDGLAAGKARIKVIDLRNGDAAEIAVEVTNDAVAESTIKVEPSTIDFGTVLQGNSKTEYFNVSNTGKHDIRFKVSKPHAPFEIPEAGNVFTLTPGNTKKFAVTCTGLTSGEASKSVFIAIGSNASNSDALGVTLTANGGGGSVGRMKVEPTSIDFGKVEYLTTKKKKLLVTNDGTGKLSFHGSYQGNAAFLMEDNGKEIALNPGETKEISVTCQGMLEGQEASGEITLVSSTGQDNTVVRLIAVGAPPTTFTLEKTTVNAPAGSVAYVNILFGSKNYSISNGNTDLVSAIIDTDNNYDYPYGRVKLLAMDEGQTVVKITDQKEKKTVSLTVTLKEDASNPFIEFSDSEVERVCLSCWDANGDGKLSKKEAAAVSDLNGVFMYNKKIRSFTELRYFTGLSDLSLDFYDCSRLEDIILPKNIKSIGWNTFYECDYLKNIHIPQNVSSIDGLSFQWSTNLKSITVSPANTTYDSRDNCNAVIQTETNTLNNGCYTTKIPSSVTAIGHCAFWGQSRLTQMDLPSSITFIGDGAFGGCRLKEVNLPASVINIDGAPFGCCYEIKSITVEPGNSVYDSREECNAIINSHTNELMQGCQNSTIPSTVTSIGMNAFKWQYYLRSITIPDNVSKIGECAFYGCNRLEDVYISANVTSIGEGAFGDCSDLSSIVVSPSNPVYDSRNNSNTIIETATNTLLHANEYSTIPDGITTIGAYALAGYDKKSLSLPEGVTTISYRAFRESSLRSLTLPSTLKHLGSAPFWECYDLNDIVCFAKEPPTVWGFDEGDQTFDVENATLHVRDVSLDKYRNAQYWEDFGNIVALPQKPAEAIDLGLPSGTKWAAYDVGAYNIGEAGDYYAWGETEPKDSYLWSTYSHCDDGTDATRHDLGNIIGTEYDVAHVKWGGDWHMPSNDQINELITYCTYEWTSFNGVNGYKFISKNNSESIFLPAAGWYNGSHHMSNGEECDFWSGNSAGSRFSFNLFASGLYGVRDDLSDCADGMTVRPVIGTGPVATKYIKVEPQSIDFGTMAAGSSETEYITVANVGSGTINFHFDYTSDFITVTGGDKENIVLEVGQTHTFPVVCTIPKNCQSSGEAITIYVRSDADNEKEVSIKASVTIIPGSDTEVPAEAIDLGLPSGTRWASYNVGATKPEDLGAQYAWGEIEEKSDYTEENYLYNGQNLGSNICGTEYDVAHVKWGGNWQMPTKKQVEELISKCTYEVVDINGISGGKFTGPNGNSVFFPAVYIGRGESYWSGTPSDDESEAYVLDVQRGCGTMYDLYRYRGYRVRPIEVSNMIPPAITVVPEDIHFGVVKLGTDMTRELTVTNTGNTNVTVKMDGCTKYTDCFDVSDNQEEVTLAPGESKVYTVTAHGTKAGCRPTQLLLIECSGLEEAMKVGMSSYGDDDDPIVNVTELSLKVGETADVKVRNSGYYSSLPDVDDIIELQGRGGPGVSGGPIDRHNPFYNYSESGMTVKALKAGIAHITFTDHHTNHTSVLTVTVTDGSTTEIPAGAIDLGLPSGTLWASCNVGATKPEEAGGYYAWGETEEKESYDRDSYLHNDDNIGSDIQGTEYDVAHVKWGDGWVMPNNNEINELIRNCSSEWITINGVNCLKFTGSNGRYIYLPDCEYWSSQHHDMVDTAYYWGAVTLNKGYVSKSQSPFAGKNVRPIKKQ